MAVLAASEKASIAKCAMEIGVIKAICTLEKQFPHQKLKESTVWAWVSKLSYTPVQQASRKHKHGSEEIGK